MTVTVSASVSLVFDASLLPSSQFCNHSLAFAIIAADVEDAEDLPKWKRVLLLVKSKVPPFMSEFYLRTIDPDYCMPPKRGRDLYIYTFPLQLFLLVWILFGYSAMFDSELDAGGFTSNKLSGFMVLQHGQRRRMHPLGCTPILTH